MSSDKVLCLVLLATAPAAGCAHNPAPPPWRVSVAEAASRPHGAWIEVTLGAGRQRTMVAGELLAIDTENIHVLTMGGAVKAPRRDATKVALGVHRNHRSDAAIWAGLGALSTLSHGYYMVLTAPLLWGGGGGAAAASESHVGVEKSLRNARKYSRFPQGLPEGLDLAALPALPGIGPPLKGNRGK
jgi:hypothetical protein